MAGHTYKKVQNEETGRAKEQSDPADPSADSQFHLRLILCYGVVICTAIALTADGPLLPTMVTHLGGVSSSEAGTWIGIVQGSYSMAQLFVAPFMGYLSDVFGRKTNNAKWLRRHGLRHLPLRLQLFHPDDDCGPFRDRLVQQQLGGHQVVRERVKEDAPAAD